MEHDTLFQIGEAAHICGISIQSLRYFDKIGLLKPTYIDEETNYRYYSRAQIFTVTFLKMLRNAGFSLLEIKTFLEKRRISDISGLYKNKILEISGEIEKLNEKKTQNEFYLHFFTSLLQANEKINENELGIIYHKELPVQYVVSVRDTIRFDYPSLIFLYNRLLQKIFDSGLQVERKIFSIFYCDYKDMFKKIIDIELCAEAKTHFESNKNIRKIDPMQIISSLHKGRYPSTIETYEKMLAYAEKNQYQPCGNVMHKLIVPLASVEKSDDMVLEIIIPVCNL